MAPLDDLLLAEAREAQAAQAYATAQAELARVRFAAALRRLHHSGASMRDIARAVGLSHQRVHQLVDSRGWSCSFCGVAQEDRAAFIAGPGVKICRSCVGRAGAGEDPTRPVPAGEEAACSFCGKARHQVEAMAEAGPAGGDTGSGSGTGRKEVAGGPGSVRICAECLALCREIIAEQR